MLLLIVFLVCLFAVIAVGALAALSDMRGLQIPNMYSALIIAAFVLCYAVLWLSGRDDVFAPLSSHVMGGAVVFIMTAAMFAGKLMGAGDSKLASALGLWVGLHGFVVFIFYTAVFGGLLGAASLALKKWTPLKNVREGSWVARVQAGESKVPYGVAIVAGALVSFVKIGYFEKDIWLSFLL